MSGLKETEVLMASDEDNTSQCEGLIFDLGSTVHVCSQKQVFNFLIAKEEGIVKMVDGSACEVIGTVIERDETVCALEAFWYVPEAPYNVISIRMLDEERSQI